MDVFSGGDGTSGGGKFPHVLPNGMKPRWQPGTNLPNLMERLPIKSDHQRLLVAYSDMPPGKRCRLGSPNPHPKIMKFSNQLGDFLDALKQSLFTTTTTHKRYLTRPEMQWAANTCTWDLNFPTPEEYCSTKGECCKPLRQRPRLDLAELAVALKTKSLARNHKSQSDGSGNTSAPPRHERPMQHHLADPDHDPRRRAYLAYVCLVVRVLLYRDLGA